jgi:hypothetical protein
MCSGYDPNPDELVFDVYELSGRAARKRRRKARRQRIKRKLKKGVKAIGKGVAKVGKIAGPLLTATGIGAPFGAALTAGSMAASAVQKVRKGKAGDVAMTAAKLAGELSAGGAWLEPSERQFLRNPKFRRAVLQHLATSAQGGNGTALTAISKLNRRRLGKKAA